MTPSKLLVIVAFVLFAVGAILALVDPTQLSFFVLSGLAAFALSFAV